MARHALLFLFLTCASAEVLTPPYFDLAAGKKVTATATCGDEGPELYCKLVGANADQDERVIQGQVCDICDANSESKKHPPEYAVDGMETWWQSPPLSRSMKYNEVNLTIDLGQEFHVAYVFVRMGNSPRPGLWALEKSTDYGKTFKAWQYFSDSPQDCERYFGKETLQPITRDNSVICSTEYSQIVPLEGGEIPISLLIYRPSANVYFNSSELQEWTRATNVRLRLLRTKNLYGHLMSVARQDPTVTRRYFYSIKDVEIGGRCMCNGHADNCDPADPISETNYLVCRCQHNTCGPQCAECCPGFVQKKWRISQIWDRFACEPCNCHNHSTECVYDSEIDEKGLSLDIHGRYDGGGVCQNCQHNTEGINCNKCKSTYFRPYGKRWDEYDVCQPCNCNLHYSTGNCEEETGQCECRPEFNPPNCDSCAYGYFDYPDCKPCICNLNGTDGEHCTPIGGLCPCKYNYAGSSCEVCEDGYYSPECKNCECNSVGSVSTACDKETGNCTCKSKYAGRTCNQCEAGYYSYPTCNHCNCDVSGTQPSICDDVTGQCICKTGFGGARCDQCISGYFMEVVGRSRACVPCNCSTHGSTSTACSADGKCNCLANFGGKQCQQCSPGYYKYPECLPCNCDPSGAIGSTCDDTGLCHCKPNFDGVKCDRCKQQYYNYPACEECNCDPNGVITSFAGCGSVPAGQLCQCKERVQGRICNDCKPLYWNLQEYNPMGCDECDCLLAGTLGGLGTCDTKSGHCTCKLNVGERQCNQCQDGFYNLDSDNMFGCTECDCDVGGSIDNNCNKETGQCRCHSRVSGRRCDQPIRAHYFPNLHQFQYELEEGSTPSGAVRYRNSEEVFPNYSWKGYVVFSMIQNKVINVVYIHKSPLYRLVIKYANPLKDPVTAKIEIVPENVGDMKQEFSVYMRPTINPQLLTVAGEKGLAPVHLVMNPGTWNIIFETDKEVMIDYFILIPEAYYEATVLTKLVDKPCVVGDQALCREFAYPSLAKWLTADVNNLASGATVYISNPVQLEALNEGTNSIPLLNEEQSQLQYNFNIDPPGRYVLLVEYVTPINNMNASNPRGSLVQMRFQSGAGPETSSVLYLNECPYTVPCRQVAVDNTAKIYVFDVEGSNNVVTLESSDEVGIKSITAIPESQWHINYITPRTYSLKKSGQDIHTGFSAAVDAKKVEVESGSGIFRTEVLSTVGNASAVFLNEGDFVRLDGKVPAPGEYLFVLHYFLADSPERTLDVIVNVNKVNYTASLKVEHCPSISGCRVLIVPTSNDLPIPVAENFTIIIKGGSSPDLGLDYVLVIADSDYTDAVLKQSNMLDYTREFINKCAISNYDIGANETGFCRDAMFSITAEYNSGALACACDYSGSTELECNTFGGQCPCKPNVIGRTCNTCKTGFYGFPDCRPCNCPATAICDDNGSCICPKNVIGDKCERCKPYTFNFDTLRGCDECNCDPLGVIGNRLQCQLDTGACDCKENVVGVRCDKCLAGYYAFPECAECNCDIAGTTSDVCDQSTSQCFCKKHVTGQNCGSCKEEYFNLQHDNLDGCTRCHCFGKTTRCASSHLSWAELSGMHNWTLVAIEVNKTLTVAPHTLPPSMLNETVIGAELNDAGAQSVVYFSAPQYYLGKRLTSYGGYLSYSIFYTTSTRDDGSAVSAADVIIGGPNGYIIHESIEQPPSIVEWMHGVRITEKEFRNLDDSPLTRDQLMNVLVNVTSIYIRATYWHKAVTTRLIGVSLEVGVEDYIPGSLRAASVEQCRCPKAYRGLSCEQCAEGYYRLSSGPHAGLCVPCQCHGHATSCDVNTGVCLDCTDNTMGDHCEFCVSGYYGNATEGTPGDCLICACPLLHPSNNFAIGCDLSPDGTLISCDCKPGYDGARCEYCANGYYGNPEILDDYCRPCNCSGNINVSEPGSCDSITGDCLKCVNNTAGAACNLCAPGFYGDAIFSKNCTACICDEYGMERCNPSTGICECRPGVVGAKCDQCLPNHWGLTSGQGCTPCDCGLASESEQCDDTTGQCRCAKGVTGRHCESCAAGYWNYTKEGCDHCNCNSGYSVGFMCNATGQCECLPGVVGEKCDRCPERWVLLPHEGCLECDSCTDALIFTIQNLTNLLANETQEFKDKADSFFTTQRLNYISNQTRSLRPRVDQLKGVEVNEVSNAVKQLETGARNLLRSAEFAATDSENQITRASDLTEEANKVLSQVREQAGKASDVVAHVMELSTGLELSQQPKVEGALAEAQQIMNDIAVKDLTAKKAPAFAAVANTDNQIERMNVFVQPVDEQSKKFEGLVNSTRALKDKLADLLKFTDLAQRTSDEAEKLNIKNKLSKFGNKVISVTTLNSEAMKDLIDTGIDISNGTYLLTVTGLIVANSNNALEAVNGTNQEMINRLAQLADELPNLKAVRDQALEHAIDVRSRADNLRALAERENNNTRTQHAYSAASAYSSIVQEISDGKKAAAEAEDMINKAVTINDKLNELVGPTHNKSSVLFERAAVALSVTDNQMRPNLTRAEVALDNAKATLALANDLNSAVDLSLHPLAKSSLTEQIDKSERVNSTVANTLEIMSQLGADLEASKEWAQGLPKSADEAQKKISTLVNHLNQIKEMEPNITSTQNTVEDEQQRLASRLQEVDKKLQKLREVIEQARTVANRIQVGVTFDRRSTLQPRLPDTVEEMSTSTRVSAYFKTKERDGLLLYLGNPKDTNLRRTKSDDFMVVNIQNGYPYLVMDIGDSAESGRDPVKIGSEKYVADNRWYQLIVDRVGRSVKLSIRETLDNGTEMTHSRDAMLPGQHTIFNLDKQKSKLYVGGAPADARLQDVNYPAFEGQIEELMIGDTPVGLWNFVSADNLNGARQREKMVSSQNGPQEYRFNGRSHVTKSGRGYLLPQKNHVLLFFRTYAPDGLMYLVGDDKHFFSIQMQDGRVYLQVSLGNPEELVIIGTTKMYNDGKWHKLDAGRYTTTCSLKVDEESMRKSSTSSEKDITSLDTMNFGGNNKGIVQVTSKGYDGCMRQISIDSVNIDLTDNVESIGVGYGCQFSSLVSLSGSSSYLRFTDVTTDNVQLTLKFKTAEPDGLLLVYVGRMQTASNAESLSLSMVDGKLKLMSQREQLDTALNTYNDSQWHVVTVTHGSTLRMVVDDFDYFSTDTAPEPLHILSGVLFIGGIQPGYVISSQVGTKVPFKGCIADATLNGRLLNLLEPFSNNSVTFGRCGSVVSTGGVPTDARVTWPTPSSRDVLPTLAPIIPEQETTDREVPPESAERTERPEINQPEPGLEVDRPPTSTRPTLLEPSTTYRPTTTRKPPQPEDGCKLAYDSQYAIGEPEEGYRFGTRNDSRIEYMQLPGRHRDGFDLTITFQTFDRHGGLMFYAASAEPTQFMAVYMKDSKIHYAFNCGGETALVVSLETYNDTAWHTANVVRSANHGKLTVDGRQVGETSTLCIRPQVLAAPFYYGGLETVSEIVSINLMNFYQPFKGCLKGLLMNDKYVTEIGRRVSALRCTNNVEAGIYFGPAGEHGGNYLKLLENNKVGREFSISMEIKPRNSTGLLLSVHGKKDFMVLELLENEVVANVENGKGPFHASYKLSNKFSLCDGEWHKIHAVKSTNVVTVGIDGHFSDAGIGVSPSTDTKSALFIGGHEKLGGKAGHDKTRVRGVKSRRGFTGCIRNIVIGEVKVPIPLSAAHGDTHIGVCPTD